MRGAAAAMRAAGAQVAAARPSALADPNSSLATYRRWLGLTPEGAEGAAVRREQASYLLWLLLATYQFLRIITTTYYGGTARAEGAGRGVGS